MFTKRWNKRFRCLNWWKKFPLLASKKNTEDAYEKIIEMSRNNDYTNGDLLDFKENYINCNWFK